MARTFNMGLGMVLALPRAQAPAAVAALWGKGFSASVVGELVAGQGRCRFEAGP